MSTTQHVCMSTSQHSNMSTCCYVDIIKSLRISVFMMNIISIINNKGGVGKTTITQNLGICMAKNGYKTAVIDFDAKANLSYSIKHLSLIHISEPTRRTPISYAVFCLKKKNQKTKNKNT